MENSFGTDFSDVSIHKNSDNATNIGALAYTQGNDVHFAPGQYEPGSQKGQELLGHELTHVVQQREGRVKPDTEQHKGLNINSDTTLEKEADEMGAKAAQGKMANVRNRSNEIQLKEDDNTVKTSLSADLDFAGLYQGRRVYTAKTPQGWFPILRNLQRKVSYKGKSYSVYEFYLKGFILCSNNNGTPTYKGKFYAPPSTYERTHFLNAVFHKNSGIVMPDMIRASNPIDRVKVNYFDDEFQTFLIQNQILIYESLANKGELIDSLEDDNNKLDGMENVFAQTGAVLEQRGLEYLQIMINGAVSAAFKGLGYFASASEYLRKSNELMYNSLKGDAINMIMNSGTVLYSFLDLKHYPKPDTSLQMTMFNTMLSIIPLPGLSITQTLLKTAFKLAFKEIIDIIYKTNIDPDTKIKEIATKFKYAANELLQAGKLSQDDFTDAVTMFLSNVK